LNLRWKQIYTRHIRTINQKYIVAADPRTQNETSLRPHAVVNRRCFYCFDGDDKRIIIIIIIIILKSQFSDE
jgi:hypothetical protein